MAEVNLKSHSIGWIGGGRMGLPMAERLVKAGCDVAAWNRTRSKIESLADLGATIVDRPVELAGKDVVFTMVATQDNLVEVLFGESGVASGDESPKIVVDCSSISAEVSGSIREKLEDSGIQYLAAPVSGNGKCVKAGKLSIVASGPAVVYEQVLPYLEAIGGLGATHVGEG